jgi:peptidyl-tRNA hydrolase, PTH1 family
MRLIVGLGNPGERYRRTRHNVGFMVVDALAARGGVTRGRSEFEAWVAEATLADERVLLVKPQTFMNRSGVAVEPLLRQYGAAPADVLAVVDDVALDLTTLRLRERGSHGGHNGLRSLSEALGSDDFPRLRVGIRREVIPDDLAGYVLAEFGAEEVLVVQEVVGRAADAVECLLREGAQVAMSRFNRSEPPLA